jgi:CubicO group peptidase (beta-lactamase class C family)
MFRALFLFITCTGTLAAQQPPHPPVEEMVPKIDALVRRVFALGLTPGLGVAVVIDGRTVYEEALGWADAGQARATEETLWYVASSSKSFTGFGVALLEDAGALDLSAPITQILPQARWHPDARPDELTLAMFLAHTHGLNGNGPVVLNAAFTGAVPEARWPDLLAYHAPTGSRELRYSNLGYNVAAMAIDAVRPEGWKAYLRRSVFEPAGMHDTYMRVSGLDDRRIAKPHRLNAAGDFEGLPFEKRDITMNAAGGHLATLGDLARWITVHMDDGMLDGRRIFPGAVVQRSHEFLGRRDRTFVFFQRDGWGFGWDIGRYENDLMISRFGGYASLRSHLSFLPTRRVGVVAQTNGDPGFTLSDILAAYVYDLAAGRPDSDARVDERLQEVASAREQAVAEAAEDRATRVARQQPLPRPLTDYVGTYEGPALGRMVWRNDNGALLLRWGVLEPAVEVYDAEAGRFRVQLPGAGTVVRFTFEGDGPATSVRLFDYVATRQ